MDGVSASQAHEREPGGLERTLRDQCSAVWRLDVEGRWSCIYRQDVEGLDEIEGFAEFFSSMVSPRLERGAEVTAKMGDWMVMAVVDVSGVLVGVRNKLGNPVAIRTAMSMIEGRSQRGVTMDARPAGGRVLDLSGDAEPLRRSQRLSPRTGELVHEPVSSSWAMDSSRSHARRSPSGAPPVVAPAASVSPAGLPDPPSLDEDSEGFSFEIVFQEDGSEVEDEPMPEGVGDGETLAAEDRPMCAWGDVVAHLSLLNEQIRAHIGRRVALNYWRDILEARPELRSYVFVDAARARLRAASPTARIEASQRDALTWAHERWTARCALVVPHVDREIAAIGDAPWL